MATAIEFNHVGKQYRLGLVSTGTISHDLNRWWQTAVLRKEDPYLKIGSVNDRTQKADSDYVWALRDIDFKIEQGDVVGIIGKNGAGKSTLLKLLSKVTGPTVGSIRARGRIASLLEVGTGFHSEMTGRENIFMNGAILGMTKAEIASKLDEIVDFSGCERYLDTPVKRYSSGMMVRLGFAVAAHLDPEILVVDEVLAVGDAEFQKKAIGKMQDVSRGEGRTVLFVSHNMQSVKALCQSGIVLENGQILRQGCATDCVEYYLGKKENELRTYTITSKINRPWEMPLNLELISARLLSSAKMSLNESLEVELEIKRNWNNQAKQFSVELTIDNFNDVRIGSFVSHIFAIPDKDYFKVHVKVNNHNLSKGKYTIGINVGLKDEEYAYTHYDVAVDMLTFQVEYRDADKKVPIALWKEDWGNCHWRQGEVEII